MCGSSHLRSNASSLCLHFQHISSPSHASMLTCGYSLLDSSASQLYLPCTSFLLGMLWAPVLQCTMPFKIIRKAYTLCYKTVVEISENLRLFGAVTGAGIVNGHNKLFLFFACTPCDFRAPYTNQMYGL